jgi:hypothetical protein
MEGWYDEENSQRDVYDDVSWAVVCFFDCYSTFSSPTTCFQLITTLAPVFEHDTTMRDDDENCNTVNGIFIIIIDYFSLLIKHSVIDFR